MGVLSSTSSTAPPLDMSVRIRLSIMMFLQFAVWGSWFVSLGSYLKDGLNFKGPEIGSVYGTMALGAVFSMMLAGQLADRLLASEWLMAIFHLAGAGLLYLLSTATGYSSFWWIAFAYALVFNPTLSISNSLAFANVPDATRDFPTLRVLGTIGWIAGGLAVDFVLPEDSAQTNRPILLAAALSAVLGVFSLTLPHTPPSGKKGELFPFLRAFTLLSDFSFAVFFGLSFAITIALAFYYNFTNVFLTSSYIKNATSIMSLGQVSEIVFMLALPIVLMRLGMKWVLVIGMAAWALRYGFFSLAATPGIAPSLPLILMIVGVVLHGVCFDFFLAAGFIHTENKAPASIRGSAQALFSFLTYGVGMWIGSEISGRVVGAFTTPHVPDVPQLFLTAATPNASTPWLLGYHVTQVRDVTRWSDVWLVPAIGAAVCLALFLLLWRDKAGKLEEDDAPIPEGAAPAEANPSV
jgi:nucleoside transporter